jgi:hypothetical protein
MASYYTLDGIAYSVTVSGAHGAYYATWSCMKCKVRGGPTHVSSSAEDAVGRAQARAFSEHHFDCHVLISAAEIRQATREPTRFPARPGMIFG